MVGHFPLQFLLGGVYGLLHYSVVHRMREIGIRMALGAGRTAVIRAVVGEELKLAACGTAIGLLAIAMLSRVLRNAL